MKRKERKKERRGGKEGRKEGRKIGRKEKKKDQMVLWALTSMGKSMMPHQERSFSI